MKGYITYYVHNGSIYLFPHYATMKELTAMINELRAAAVEDIRSAIIAYFTTSFKSIFPCSFS